MKALRLCPGLEQMMEISLPERKQAPMSQITAVIAASNSAAQFPLSLQSVTRLDSVYNPNVSSVLMKALPWKLDARLPTISSATPLKSSPQGAEILMHSELAARTDIAKINSRRTVPIFLAETSCPCPV